MCGDMIDRPMVRTAIEIQLAPGLPNPRQS
jgi:hypothetical protein